MSKPACVPPWAWPIDVYLRGSSPLLMGTDRQLRRAGEITFAEVRQLAWQELIRRGSDA